MPSATQGRGKDGTARKRDERLLPRSIQADFARTVTELAPRLGLDLRRLQHLHGALGIHLMRSLFGSYWVRHDPDMTRLMLHHTSLNFTIRLYSGRSESNVRFELKEFSAARVPSAEERLAELSAELKLMKRRNRELQDMLDESNRSIPPSERTAEAA